MRGRLRILLPSAGVRDSLLLPILGHGAAGDGDALFCQLLTQQAVAQGLLLVLLVNDSAQRFLDASRSHGLGAGSGFIEAVVNGGYRWVGYGVIITVVPLLIVSFIARLGMKRNYYTLMGLIAGSTTDPPALAYANATAGNDMPAVSYATVYPVVMFLRVLTAQIFILFAL